MIRKGDFVRISYTAKLEDGTVIDTTDEKTAKEHGIYREEAKYGDIVVVVGEGQVVKGLDEMLEGKEVGFKGSIEIPPEKAFGKYDPNKREFISISKFRERPSPGQRVLVGEKVGTVEKVIGRRVLVNYNHPLAGKKIIFDLEIKEKIEDTREKVKSLITIYTGRDVEVKVENSKAVIEKTFDPSTQKFLSEKVFKLVPEVSEIVFIERFKR